tara:strand:+ start:82 stop:1092 length:1011 start_codon:yes stop_codon:yes gene_type:complete
VFEDKIITITGGTGSFGNAVLKKFLSTGIKEIRIFSRDEKKQDDMRKKYKNPKIKFYLGDVRNYNSLTNVMRGTDFVFHAAALKQVPSCEFYPIEAVSTNILGTDNLIRAATNNKVKKIVLLSTDKAVYPINAMGMSKALAEKILIANSRLQSSNETLLCITRYGNVMASRGSVIPLFVKQIKNKEKLTITDPNMTRFLMSLEESVELVTKAFSEAEQGDIFVQKAPATTIDTLAKALQSIFSSNLSIDYIGTRHGEKVFESLISREEMVKAKSIGKFYKIPSDNRDLNYTNFMEKGKIIYPEISDYTSHNAKRLNIEETIETLLKLPFIKEQINA